MDTLNAEFGLTHVVRAPGYTTKTKIYEKVVEADTKGLVRRMSSPVASMFMRPQLAVHFELFVGGRFCMARGIMSKETTVSDADAGYVRENHVWLIFSSKTARHVAVDINPLVGREFIWLRPVFTWDHQVKVEFKEGTLCESTAALMDSLAHVVGSITSEDQLDSLTCEASRLRCIFAHHILAGETQMPDVKLPFTKYGWTRNSVLRCWGQAKLLVDPMSSIAHVLQREQAA